MVVKRRSSARPSANPSPPSARVANALLTILPADDYNRIVPTLDIVPLKLKHVLQKPGDAIDHVYYPGGGFCSILTVLEDGGMVEVATIGREGVVGVSAAWDGGAVPSLAMVQAETDTCYRMTVAAFRHEMDQRGAFYEIHGHYAQALVGFIMQATACNAAHSVEKRLARWLLLAQDRVGTDAFPLTQEFVAMMLGASRPTVTLVAGTLQKAGLIKYRRGLVTIVDRESLEAASCECYRAVTRLLERVTNGSRRPGSRR